MVRVAGSSLVLGWIRSDRSRFRMDVEVTSQRAGCAVRTRICGSDCDTLCSLSLSLSHSPSACSSCGSRRWLGGMGLVPLPVGDTQCGLVVWLRSGRGGCEGRQFNRKSCNPHFSARISLASHERQRSLGLRVLVAARAQEGRERTLSPAPSRSHTVENGHADNHPPPATTLGEDPSPVEPIHHLH